MSQWTASQVQFLFVRNLYVLVLALTLACCEYASHGYPQSFPELETHVADECPDISGHFKDRPMRFVFDEAMPVLQYRMSLSAVFSSRTLSHPIHSKSVLIKPVDDQDYEVTVILGDQPLSVHEFKRRRDFACNDGWMIIDLDEAVDLEYGVGLATNSIKLSKSSDGDLVGFIHVEIRGLAAYVLPAYLDQEYWAMWRDDSLTEPSDAESSIGG